MIDCPSPAIMAKPNHMNGKKLPAMENTCSLEELQSHEQRVMLNAVGALRHHGLENLIPLPQIVVCGDQSAGKSSVLEAISEIPFPRNDNLCTRFATEIVLRYAQKDSIMMSIIPSHDRPKDEQETIRGFCEFILDFNELPGLIDKAMSVMGIQSSSQKGGKTQAFARDVLSVTIEGPTRAHLTLVDLPGLIQTQSKGVTAEDIKVVRQITDHYISQPRTITLAVISAAYDHPCQGILQKALSQQVDPHGKRTLGVITKPDRLAPGSGAESAYIDLASNKDIFLHLGWHVLKNRAFDEGSVSFEKRNILETEFFSTSNFNSLDDSQLGIASLRKRLSDLLFNHTKRELPKLHSELVKALADSSKKLNALGDSRVTVLECKEYLTHLSIAVHKHCEAALNGNYIGDFFNHHPELRRLRATIQHMNVEFTDYLRHYGHKYHFQIFWELENSSEDHVAPPMGGSPISDGKPVKAPKILSKSETLDWIKNVLGKTRGRELPGNFNALVIGELFWEQSGKWEQIAEYHLRRVSKLCTQFMQAVLGEFSAKHVHTALWNAIVRAALKQRLEAAEKELASLTQNLRDYPINYNHYYTDTKRKRRIERDLANKRARMGPTPTQTTFGTPAFGVDLTDEAHAPESIDPNMDNQASVEALDSLMAIYKVSEPNSPKRMLYQIFLLTPVSKALAEDVRRQRHYPSHRTSHRARLARRLFAAFGLPHVIRKDSLYRFRAQVRTGPAKGFAGEGQEIARRQRDSAGVDG